MTQENGKRSTGELYDAIWNADMPLAMDKGDERAPGASGHTTRLVLMAMAKFTNPSRDQVNFGLGREWRCYASVARLAELARTSERQVFRVQRTLEHHGWIERRDEACGPGRPKKGELPPANRATEWFIKPDRFVPAKFSGAGRITHESGEIAPVPASYVPVPVQLPPENTPVPVAADAEKYTGAVTQTRTYVEPGVNENPSFGLEPSRAPAREELPPGRKWEPSTRVLFQTPCVECGRGKGAPKNAEGVCFWCVTGRVQPHA